MPAFHRVVPARDDGHKGWWHGWRGLEMPHFGLASGLVPYHRSVGAHPPNIGCDDSHGDSRLEVGLIETRENFMRVEGCQLGVQIHFAVNRVSKPVEPDAGMLILAVRGHEEAVGSGA